MAIKVTHSGTTYTCETAIKCTSDKYIKLFDANGVEIVSFEQITDFSEFTISGGSFTDPASCEKPIMLTTYVVGGKTIQTNDWTQDKTGEFIYEIQNNLISANENTCDILLIFGNKHLNFEYYGRQEDGKLILSTPTKPGSTIYIKSIQITRV